MSWNRGTATLEPSHHGTALLVTAASLANERDDLELFIPVYPPETSMTMENPPFEDVLYLKILCWTWGLSNVILVIRGVYFYATVDSTVGQCPILRVFVGTVCSICVMIFFWLVQSTTSPRKASQKHVLTSRSSAAFSIVSLWDDTCQWWFTTLYHLCSTGWSMRRVSPSNRIRKKIYWLSYTYRTNQLCKVR